MVSYIRGGCIIWKKGTDLKHKFLLAVFQNASGYWGFPKGKVSRRDGCVNYTNIHKNIDSIKYCASREAKEECSLDINVNDLLYNEANCIKVGYHYYFVVYDYSGDVKVGDRNPYDEDREIGDYKWVTLSEFERLPISKSTEKLLVKLRKKLEDSGETIYGDGASDISVVTAAGERPLLPRRGLSFPKVSVTV